VGHRASAYIHVGESESSAESLPFQSLLWLSLQKWIMPVRVISLSQYISESSHVWVTNMMSVMWYYKWVIGLSHFQSMSVFYPRTNTDDKELNTYTIPVRITWFIINIPDLCEGLHNSWGQALFCTSSDFLFLVAAKVLIATYYSIICRKHIL